MSEPRFMGHGCACTTGTTSVYQHGRTAVGLHEILEEFHARLATLESTVKPAPESLKETYNRIGWPAFSTPVQDMSRESECEYCGKNQSDFPEGNYHTLWCRRPRQEDEELEFKERHWMAQIGHSEEVRAAEYSEGWNSLADILKDEAKLMDSGKPPGVGASSFLRAAAQALEAASQRLRTAGPEKEAVREDGELVELVTFLCAKAADCDHFNLPKMAAKYRRAAARLRSAAPPELEGEQITGRIIDVAPLPRSALGLTVAVAENAPYLPLLEGLVTIHSAPDISGDGVA